MHWIWSLALHGILILGGVIFIHPSPIQLSGHTQPWIAVQFTETEFSTYPHARQPKKTPRQIHIPPPASIGGSSAQSEPSSHLGTIESWEYYQPAPDYPELARKNGLQGQVTVAFETNEKGFVKAIKVTVSSGSSILDDQAIETVKNWRLSALLKAELPITFQLTD